MTLLCFNVGNDWNYLSMEWISKFITVYMIRMMHILAYFEPTHPNSMMMLIIFHSSKDILPRWFIAHLKSILPQLRCIQQHDDAMQWKRFVYHWPFKGGYRGGRTGRAPPLKFFQIQVLLQYYISKGDLRYRILYEIRIWNIYPIWDGYKL